MLKNISISVEIWTFSFSFNFFIKKISKYLNLQNAKWQKKYHQLQNTEKNVDINYFVFAPFNYLFKLTHLNIKGLSLHAIRPLLVVFVWRFGRFLVCLKDGRHIRVFLVDELHEGALGCFQGLPHLEKWWHIS